MNKWLEFSNSNLETSYQNYLNKNAAKNHSILLYSVICYGLINSLSIITEYVASDIEKYKTSEWLIVRLIIVITCCILLYMLFLTSKKYKIFTKLRDHELFKLVIAIILQAIFDEQILEIQDFSEGKGYEYFWNGYQIQFYSLILCLIFKRWTYRILYFCCSSLYYGLLKIRTNYDRIQNIQQVGLCILFGLIVYYIEKNSREDFLEFQIVTEKETIWKKFLENLPEDILIIDNLNNIKYHNNHLKKQYLYDSIDKNNDNENLMDKIHGKDIFLKRVKNLSLRESNIDLKLRFQKSLTVSNVDLEKKATIELQNKGTPIELEKQASFKKMNSLSKSLPPISKEPLFALSDIVAYLNKNPNFFIDDQKHLTFDGTLDGRSIELKVLSIVFENQKCLMSIIFDTAHKDIIKKLEENDKYKNIILATVSHELRNPLNSSMTMLQLAVKENTIPRKYREELLEPCLRSLGMLANLINDILDYSQIQANKLKLIFQYVDLRQLVYDACLLIDTQCRRKGLKLRAHIDAAVPEMIKTDPNRLTQVLLNLLSNALKFTVEGYIRIFINLKDNDKNQISITVKDTGIGIHSDDIPKLFQEYGKLDLGINGKLNPTGCGLGLNISQKLAILLGNEESNDCGIKVESVVGKETSFSFTIQHKGQINSKKDISPPRSRKPTEDFLADICTTAQSGMSYLKAPNPRQRKNNINLLTRYRSENIIEENFEIEIDEGEKANPQKYTEDNYFDSFIIKRRGGGEGGRGRGDADGEGGGGDKFFEDDSRKLTYDSPKLTYGSSLRLLSEGETDINEAFKDQNRMFREKNIRILLVYNKYFSMSIQKKIWDEIGYYCSFAFLDEDIKEKLKEIGEQKISYNLIIVDSGIKIENVSMIIQMLKEEIKKKGIQTPPVIASTENFNIDLKLKYQQIGVHDIIKKPLTKDKLNTLIKI